MFSEGPSGPVWRASAATQRGLGRFHDRTALRNGPEIARIGDRPYIHWAAGRSRQGAHSGRQPAPKEAPMARTSVFAIRGLAALLAAAALGSLVSGCTPRTAEGLPREALDDAIGRALGDPNTCVLLADRASGQVVYRYGAASTCSMSWPACDRPGNLQAGDALRLATPQGRLTSCASAPGRRVGWAAGQASGTRALN